MPISAADEGGDSDGQGGGLEGTVPAPQTLPQVADVALPAAGARSPVGFDFDAELPQDDDWNQPGEGADASNGSPPAADALQGSDMAAAAAAAAAAEAVAGLGKSHDCWQLFLRCDLSVP